MSANGDPLGVDIYWPAAFPLKMRLSWGQENLQTALLRRLTTDQGCLASINDNADYGHNIYSRLHGKINTAIMSAENGAIVAEVLKDPRVQSAQAQIVSAPSAAQGGAQVSQIFINGQSSSGPFAMVIPVSQLSQGLLNRGLVGAAPVGASAVSEPITIVSQTGPQGPAGASGASVGGGGGGGLVPNLDGFYASDVASEQFADGDQVDFSRITSNPVSLEYSFLGQVPSGGTGTVRFRVGGTAGALDGTVVATATVTTSGSYATIGNTVTFTKPSGIQQIKVTIQISTDGLDVLVKQVNVSLF
jgi:hypothetical protein